MTRFRQAVPVLQAAFFCALFCLVPARGESLEVAPELAQALPWNDTPQGVKATVPFLLNPATIVPAGAALRIFYVRPSADSSDGPKLISNDAPKEAAYSRQSGGSSEALSPVKKSLNDVELAIRAAHQTVWPNIASFRAAFALLGSPDLRLVYQASGAADLADQPFNPVQGLILSEGGDHAVTVCGVVQGSNAARVGFAAGDRIDALNGAPLNGSLATFVGLYADAGVASTISKPKPYVFRVRHAGSETPVDLAIRPPPSLSGSLLDQ